MAETDTAAAKAAPKKGGALKIVAIGALMLVAGGGAGAWWLMRGTAAKAEEKEVSAEKRGLLPFETFLVNLADAGGTRFLKLNVQLVLGSVEEAKKVEETPVLMAQLRSTILELLTQQQAAVLVSAEGKQELKKHIQERAAEALHDHKVIDVLFSEFVVQF
jgi:flagellar FliL protein